MRRIQSIVVAGLLGALLACPVAAQQGKGSKKPDEPKRPVDIVREPKSDPNKGQSGNRNGGNSDRGSSSGDKKGKNKGDEKPPL